MKSQLNRFSCVAGENPRCESEGAVVSVVVVGCLLWGWEVVMVTERVNVVSVAW